MNTELYKFFASEQMLRQLRWTGQADRKINRFTDVLDDNLMDSCDSYRYFFNKLSAYTIISLFIVYSYNAISLVKNKYAIK